MRTRMLVLVMFLSVNAWGETIEEWKKELSAASEAGIKHKRAVLLLEYTNGETKFVKIDRASPNDGGGWDMVEVEKTGQDTWVSKVPDNHPKKDLIERMDRNREGMLGPGSGNGTEPVRRWAPELVIKKKDWNIDEGEFTEDTYKRFKAHIAKRKELYERKRKALDKLQELRDARIESERQDEKPPPA